ncbi:uncharacterized protein LOC132190869 [Corylus avellana]|uniref:uncharacterized protein LOC132190869 n=1 Tax=Corylus avellana TaxID=13451 RepID=UPI00286C39B5|nr:uncharacterized protein LOC132190869 [Corylus avellana]
MEDEVSFQIRSMQPKHVCGRKYKSSIVNSTWIANQLIEKFKVQPNMPLEVIQHEVKEKWRVDVTPSIMYRARRKAGKQIYGKLEGQYGRLWDYCETLRKTNKGTCIMMKVERPNPNLPPRFQRLYVSLAAMKKGFIEGCRPIIGVDGCFLKGAFKGQLLAAVSRDGNNNMYPIAFAVVEAETKDSWIWFLETLVSDLGTHDRHARPTFISDRQKGLIPALNEVLPMADHRFCVRHLYANFKNEGHKGVAFKEMLWGAASAYTEGEFTAYMEGLRGMNKDAYEYLNRVDPSCWSRAWFSEYSKCDLLVNNICECFNSYILKARDKPILTMLEMIRKKLMRRYQAKREGIEKLTGKLCPRIVTKLEEIGIAASDCVAVYAGEYMFEVTCPTGKQFVVDLRRKLCGCRQWEITGIPCPHAFCAILYDCGDSEDYVDECYTIERYKKAYAPIIYPMPSEEQWIKTQHDHLEPPTSRLQPGRPKKQRKRGPDESRDPKNPNRMRKFGARMRCSKCKVLGHNKRACPTNMSGASNYKGPTTPASSATNACNRGGPLVGISRGPEGTANVSVLKIKSTISDNAVAIRQVPPPGPPASRTRQSDRLKGICPSTPINPGVPIHIDLTGQVASSRAETQPKGKRIVTTIEKGIGVMEAKKKKMMKPNWKH